MADKTKIEWAHKTWSPWLGCTNISSACDHCYAEKWAKRSGLVGWGPGQRRRTSPDYWKKPLKWNEEARTAGTRFRVFPSLCDPFDNDRAITSGWHGDLWNLIDRTPYLDWMLLTKRPQNIKKQMPETYGMREWGNGWNNVWLGITAEDQEQWDIRHPHLFAVNALVRFASMEPLLGRVDMCEALGMWWNGTMNAWEGTGAQINRDKWGNKKLHMAITGGESGGIRRNVERLIDDIKSIDRQCEGAGVAHFVKQDAALHEGKQGRIPDCLWAKKQMPGDVK